MKAYSEMAYHPLSEMLVEVLRNRTQSEDHNFFRMQVAYYFCLAASHMRVQVASPDRGTIPVNGYFLNLAPSGYGKTLSANLMQKEVLYQFRERFIEETFPLMAEQQLPQLAYKRSIRKQSDPDKERELLDAEFERTGPMEFLYGTGTTVPAVRQLRHKCTMANGGSLNFQVDEIGANLSGNLEMFNTYIEMYDVGEIIGNLLKNSSENKRSEMIQGNVPANMLLFGVAQKLFDGGKTEEDLMTLLDMGYARRCFFSYVQQVNRKAGRTARSMFEDRVKNRANPQLEALADRLGNLADIINAHRKLIVSEANCLLLNEYQLDCERRAEDIPDIQEMRKREMSERAFKVLKLAGAYAFMDDSPEVTEDHLYSAMRLAEDSGKAFEQMLNRDKPHVKLARYLASVGTEVTQADLVADLPFYKGTSGVKQDMLMLAIAYGYKNNIIIKKAFQDGVEFLRGESLKETDLTQMIVSYSTDITTGYRNDTCAFNDLHKMTQAQGIHWVGHHLKDGYRNTENAIPGFNLVVIDVDGGVSLATAKLLLKDYKALYYTTKRHQVSVDGKPPVDRFRILLPTNYELKLDAKDYKEFMANLNEWLPFKADESTGQVARKWLSHAGHYEYADGQVLDVLPFIPKTSKAEEHKALMHNQQSMDNLERWVINNTGDGNRNNQLLKYAYILVDAGYDFEGVRTRVISLNDKLADKLDEAEIMGSIMITVGKALAKRAAT